MRSKIMSQFGNHDDRPTKTVELSRSEVTHVVMQIDINGQGRLFGHACGNADRH